MAIKELITLEGVEAVKKSLADLNQSGEAALKQFRDLGQQPGMENLSATTEDFSRSLSHANEATRGFREGLHILRPVLSEIGGSMGGLGHLAIAAHAGLAGLAVAVAGTIVVALSKLADETATAQRRLETLLNLRPTTGGGALSQLDDTAAKLGTDAQRIQPIIEKFVGALRQASAATGAVFVVPPGESQPAILAQDFEKAKPAALALFEALRIGGATQAKAAEEASKFGDAIKRSGTINGELIRSLDPLGGGIKAVADALHLTGLNAEQLADRLDKRNRSIKELISGLAQLEPALRAALKLEPVTAFDDAVTKVITSWSRFFSEVANSKFSVGFLDVVSRMPEDFNAAVAAIKKDFSDLSAFLVTTATTAWETVTTIFTTPIVLDTLISSFQSFWDQVVQSAQNAYNNIQNLFANPITLNIEAGGASGFLGPGGAPFAGGGLVRGPGTASSDSILARLSNQEFVVNARAVSFYGADLLHALNAMRLPKDLLPSFNMGGLARAMMGSIPRFAEGGMVMTQQTPVTLVIDQQRFTMTATGDTVKALSRFAVARQVTSTGRKPSWVR